MLVIGDIHGKYKDYLNLLNRFPDEPSVQIGDFGFGFGPVPPRPEIAKFFRGNHDAPNAARLDPHYLGDYGMRELGGVRFFFLGGAWSIDQQWRSPGISWWPDEELSMRQLGRAIDEYIAVKPAIMLTHDGPHQATDEILSSMEVHKTRPTVTRTGAALAPGPLSLVCSRFTSLSGGYSGTGM